MEDNFLNWEIETREQASILLSQMYAPIMHALWQEPKTVMDLSSELQEDSSKIYYKVKNLERAGLVGIAFEKGRRGKSLKYYQMLKESYFVPFGMTDSTTLEEMISDTIGASYKEFIAMMTRYFTSKYDSASAGFNVKASPSGVQKQLHLPDENESEDIISIWVKLDITKEDVDEIIELTRKMFNKRKTPDGEKYIFGLHLIREGIG